MAKNKKISNSKDNQSKNSQAKKINNKGKKKKMISSDNAPKKIKYQDLDIKVRTTKKSGNNLKKLQEKMREPEYRVASSSMWLLNGLNKKDLQKIIPKFTPFQLERICKLLMDNIDKVNKICQDQLLQRHFNHYEEYNKFALYLISRGRATFYAFLENPKLYYTPLLSIHKGVKHHPRMAESILFMDEIDKWVDQNLHDTS